MNRITLTILICAGFLVSVAHCQTPESNTFAIPSADELAWELNGNRRVNYKYYHVIPPYIQGRLKIVSGKNSGVVVGIDEDGDGNWEEFIGIQTTHAYHLNDEIENGEVIYASRLAIVNSKDDNRIYILRVLGKEADELRKKIPKELRNRITLELTGFGLNVHTGNRDFNEFID